MKAVKIILLSVGYTVSGLLFAFALMGVLLGWWLEGEVIAKTAGLLFFCVPLSVMLWRPWEELARRFAQWSKARSERVRARSAVRMKNARSRKAADDDDDFLKEFSERSDCGTFFGIY